MPKFTAGGFDHASTYLSLVSCILFIMIFLIKLRDQMIQTLNTKRKYIKLV